MPRVSEYGIRWDVRVPRGDIHWLVGKLHVGTPDSEIEADIRKRCDPAKGFTPRLVAQSVRYALLCHQRNRDLYAYVYGGNR